MCHGKTEVFPDTDRTDPYAVSKVSEYSSLYDLLFHKKIIFYPLSLFVGAEEERYFTHPGQQQQSDHR